MSAQITAHTADREITSTHSHNWLKIVAQHVEDLRFGSVVITVHEGKVVQVEVSTKVRFEKVH
ncbi:MAG: YezD family protein [Verrucomicrobia bacterium]|nr:YezD family protein [Verrucomicrobiota bacterium]